MIFTGMKTRYTIVLVGLSISFILLSILAAFFTLDRLADQIRSSRAIILAQLVEEDLRDRDPFRWFSRLKQTVGFDLNFIQMWIFASDGKLVTATSPNGPAPDWQDLPHPEVPHRMMRAPRQSAKLVTGVVRLKTSPPLFVVFQMERFGPLLRYSAWMTFFFCIWAIVGCSAISLALVVTYFRTRAREAVSVLERIQQGELHTRFATSRIDEVGRLMRLFNYMADEIERLVRNLERAEGARTEFLQELGHDTRTPLTALRASLATLHDDFGKLDEHERRRCIVIAFQETVYLQTLIEELFFLAEMNEPKYREDVEEVALVSLVRSEIDRRQVLEAGDFRREWSLEANGLEKQRLRGSSRLLLRLVRNALDNAAKHARRSVRVCVTEDESRDVTILVEDDGPGVPESALLEFGSRRVGGVSEGAFSSGRSLGLGSVIMRQVAELHGGNLRLENVERGGARLRITLKKIA